MVSVLRQPVQPVFFLATHLSVPVSTTHVITGAISGVGSAYRLTAVRWNVTVRIVSAWILTIPAAAALAGLIYLLARLFLPA
jgi:PiT family inorganic phosphate transporter